MVCVAGSFLGTLGGEPFRFPHRWTEQGVELAATFTGAHMLHAAVAACVLNDLYREAAGLGVELAGVRVEASGGFDENWTSKGIEYLVQVDSLADAAVLQQLLERVDEVAEVPRALRASTSVGRVGMPD